MKYSRLLLAGFFILTCPSAFAETVVTTDDGTTVTVNGPNQPVAVVETQPVLWRTSPVIIAQRENPKEFEGQITGVDVPRGVNGVSTIDVLDAYGRTHKVIVKQGMISGYQVDDYVEVELMADMKEAKMIKKVPAVTYFDAVVVQVDPVASHILIRERAGEDRLVAVDPSNVTTFRTGTQVRVYAVPAQNEVRLVRVIE